MLNVSNFPPQVRYTGTKPAQLGSEHIQCQLQVDHCRSYSLPQCQSQEHEEVETIPYRPSANCSWTALQCSWFFLFQYATKLKIKGNRMVRHHYKLNGQILEAVIITMRESVATILNIKLQGLNSYAYI